MPDQLFGNYRVLHSVGAGGMAKVYLGVHKDVANLKVVLKVLSDPRMIERFRQEADKLALLDGHPNVCQIKDFFSHGDDAVIAMEFIDGSSLDDLLKLQSPMSVDESVRILTDVVGVLEFAHQRGVYHRDIKPSNIMLDKSGQVKIIDFGIAKGESDPSLTTAGAMCGTPAYMAPEQFTQTDKTNYALIDIYAAGTTLYRMVTGELPFKGDNEFLLRDAKLFTDPPKPRSLNGKISGELERVILKAIDKDPLNRYPSMTEFRHALLTARGAAPKDSASMPDRMERTMAAGPAARKKKSILPVILAGVVVILAAALGGYFLLKGGGEDKTVEPKLLELVSPLNGAVVTDTRRPMLSWSATGQAAFGYELEYATDSLFSDGIPVTGLQGRSCTLSEDLDNGRYFWRVYPIDSMGALGKMSKAFSFVIDVADTTSEGSQLVTAERGLLQVTVEPSGDIYLDDRKVGSNSYTAALDTGTYHVRVENSKSREKAINDTVRISDGPPTNRTYRFTIPPPPVQEKLAEVRIGSRPRGADIYIDGELQKQQTNFTFRLKPGSHVFRGVLVVDGEAKDESDTVNIAADSVSRVFFEFE